MPDIANYQVESFIIFAHLNIPIVLANWLGWARLSDIANFAVAEYGSCILPVATINWRWQVFYRRKMAVEMSFGRNY